MKCAGVNAHNEILTKKGQAGERGWHRSNVRKIVATTNPELWVNKQCETYKKEHCGGHCCSVPKIDIPFIEFYIKAYNKGNPITEVLLEQSVSYMENDFHKVEVQYKQQLTRRANGSVVIYLEEEKKYTREELKIAVRDTLWGAKGFSPMGQDDYDDFDKYFNERFPE